MAQRRIILTIAVFALAGLSAHHPSAPPPLPQLAAVASAPQAAPVVEPLPAPPAEAAAIDEHLRSFNTGLSRTERAALAEEILAAADRHGLKPELILAVMHVESGNYNFAVSPVRAMGLMQLLPATGEEMAATLGISWYGPQTLFDPVANVRLGTAYLKWLVDRYGRIDVALAAYNWGPGRIDRRLRRGTPLPVTYAHRVLDVYGSGPGARESRS